MMRIWRYLLLYIAVPRKLLVCYTRVDGADYITFSWNSAFWIFNWVSNMVYPRYDLMIGDVRAAQKRDGDNL